MTPLQKLGGTIGISLVALFWFVMFEPLFARHDPLLSIGFGLVSASVWVKESIPLHSLVGRLSSKQTKMPMHPIDGLVIVLIATSAAVTYPQTSEMMRWMMRLVFRVIIPSEIPIARW